MEKIFANDVTNMGLISNIHKQFIRLNFKKNQKMSRILKQIFLQRRHTDAQQAHEKILNIANYEKSNLQ